MYLYYTLKLRTNISKALHGLIYDWRLAKKVWPKVLLKMEKLKFSHVNLSQGHTEVVAKPRLNLSPQVLSPIAF